MRRVAAAAFALALIAVACGGSDDATTTTGAGATTTTAGGGTSATTAAATTTEALTGGRAIIAQAVGFEGGVYEGEWNNTTFGSSGSVKITISEVNTESGFILAAIDLGGNVFGEADPEPFTVEIYSSGEGVEMGFSTFFRETTISIGEDGQITLSATPAAVGEIVIEGVPVVQGPNGSGFEGTYSIPGLAEGTWNAYRTG